MREITCKPRRKVSANQEVLNPEQSHCEAKVPIRPPLCVRLRLDEFMPHFFSINTNIYTSSTNIKLWHWYFGWVRAS